MAKVRKNYRFSEETLGQLETLIPFLSAEKGIQLDETKVLELLIAERYSDLLTGLERDLKRSAKEGFRIYEKTKEIQPKKEQ